MNGPVVVDGITVVREGDEFTFHGPKGRALTPYRGHNGYMTVQYKDGRRRVARSVHRLVCEAFHGPAPADKPLALHRDGNRMNNAPENLYWGDYHENLSDAFRHGNYYVADGEDHRAAKLTWDQVEAIRSEYATGGVTQAELGRKYGVTRHAINDIFRGRTWKGARP